MHLLRTLLLGFVAVVLAQATAKADDFRIESKLFVGDAKEPASENVTLFYNGMVYDYLSNPAEVTVFDSARGRFVLLDPIRHVRAEISTQHVAQFTEKLQTWAAGHEEKFLKFSAAPEFEVQSDSTNSELTFTSDWMTYKITCEDAQTATRAAQYGDFSDWYARLNTITSPSLLPFARLKINAEMRQRQRIPTEVNLTIDNNARFPRPQQEQKFRTEHQLLWRLSKSDLRKIEQTGEDLVTFGQVGFQQYRAAPAEQASK